jgi:hypothetical protein
MKNQEKKDETIIAKCPICGTDSNYNFKNWPPKKDKIKDVLIVPFLCQNNHEFDSEIPLKVKNII